MPAECVCQSCSTLTVDILHHLVFDCPNDDVNFKRLQFSQTVSRHLGTNFSNILFNLEDEELLICLLGGPSYELDNLLSENEYNDFLSISVRFISSLLL